MSFRVTAYARQGDRSRPIRVILRESRCVGITEESAGYGVICLRHRRSFVILFLRMTRLHYHRLWRDFAGQAISPASSGALSTKYRGKHPGKRSSILMNTNQTKMRLQWIKIPIRMQQTTSMNNTKSCNNNIDGFSDTESLLSH